MAFPKTEVEWADRTARHLKVELKKAEITYEQLAKKMKSHGFSETKGSITNKLARGTFPAPFYLAALVAIGLKNIPLGDV